MCGKMTHYLFAGGCDAAPQGGYWLWESTQTGSSTKRNRWAYHTRHNGRGFGRQSQYASESVGGQGTY